VNRDDFGRDILSNIEISSEDRRALYMNCKKGKRAGDFRFRHAGALSAFIITMTVGCTGIGAHAAYMSYKQRLEEMPKEEVEQLSGDLSNDTSITIDEAWSRGLNNNETLRLAELERDYYGNGRFPEGEVGRVDKLSDWDGVSVCYVEEDHLLHLPESELTDEQLLVFIDYNAKKDYVMTQEAEAYIAELPEDDPDHVTVSPYVEVTGVDENMLISSGKDEVKKLFGVDLGSEWEADISAFQPSLDNPDFINHDMYTVTWSKCGASPNSTSYTVVYGMHDLKLLAVGVGGREYWATLGSLGEAEAIRKGENDMATVLDKLDTMYGYKNPDSVEYTEVYHEYDETGDARQYYYVFMFGNVEVSVIWDLVDEKIASVDFYTE